MQRTLKNILAVLVAFLLAGFLISFFYSFIEENKSESTKDVVIKEEVTPNVIGGTQGFTTDFSNLIVKDFSSHQKRFYDESLDGYLNSQLFVEEGYGEVDIVDGKLLYACTQSNSTKTYPKIKLKPTDSNLLLADFKVLTVDFDIDYWIDVELEYKPALRALFNTRSYETGGTVCSSNDYYVFDDSGKGHYTFVYYDTGDFSTMKIFVYNDGVLVKTVSDFIYDVEYDEYNLYVACLNLELTRNEGDTVYLDNVEFHWFEDDYTGAIMELVENPDVYLKTCKDSVLYEG